MEDHLIDGLRHHRPAALPLLISAFGRDATGVAFIVLQHQADAARATADALADTWNAALSGGLQLNRMTLRREVLERAAVHALRLQRRSTTVDPRLVPAGDQRVRELSPLERAVIALVIVAELPDAAIARRLDLPPARATDLRLGAQGADPRGLRAAVRSSLEGLAVQVDAEQVRAALDRPPEQPARRGWILAGSAAALLVVAVLLVWRLGNAPPQTAAGSVSEAPATSSALAPAAAVLTPTPPGTVRPYTLGTCAIPDDLPVLYAGWVDVEQVDPSWNGQDGTVYALVTRDEHGPVACVYAPGPGRYARVRPRAAWTPPVDADGCPSSPVGTYGGTRELGGPGAFVVPSANGGEWRAGDESPSELLVRIAPPPDAGGSIGASLRSLATGEVVDGRVAAGPVEPLAPSSSERDRHAYYVRVDELRVRSAGCWVLNVTVGNSVIGAVTLPFSTGG